MIRKNMIGLFTLAIFASMQLFAPAKAAAQDHWVASDAVGYNYYVMTETIRTVKGQMILVNTREVSPDGVHSRVLEWEFIFDEGDCCCECRSDRTLSPPKGTVRNSPVAWNIIQFTWYYLYGRPLVLNPTSV